VHAALPAAEVVRLGHWEQAVAKPETEYVPAAQVWHVADTPSTKDCPALQQTPAPVGEHRSVWPAVQEAVHGIFIMLWVCEMFPARIDA
jgi:hypothetical protein